MFKKNNNFYLIQKNDNLEKIAKKYNIPALKILIINNLLPDMIKEGRILFIE